MKKTLVILAALLLVFSSCSVKPKYHGMHGEKTQMDAEAEFVSALTTADSTSVLELADKFMQTLQAGEVEEALDMIYVLYYDKIFKKSAAFTDDLVGRFKAFPVRDYELVYYSFSTQGNNDISYKYAFGPANASGQRPTIKLMLNPVLVDGVWYLTLKMAGQSSKDLPKDKQIHDYAPAPEDIVVYVKPESAKN